MMRTITSGPRIPPPKSLRYLCLGLWTRRLLEAAEGDRLEALYTLAAHTGMRQEDQKACISSRTRRIGEWVFPLPGRGRGPLHHYFSEFFDWNEPPLFKNFLQIEASERELCIRCFAATGCREHEEKPPLEDEVKIKL